MPLMIRRLVSVPNIARLWLRAEGPLAEDLEVGTVEGVKAIVTCPSWHGKNHLVDSSWNS
jgi:hypothetical protein